MAKVKRLIFGRDIGQRGRVLVTMGALWVLIGVSTLGEEPREYLLHERAGFPESQFLAWSVTGVVAIAYGFRRVGSHDQWGWLALYLMPAIRCVGYSLSWVDYVTPLGGPGYDRGWSGALVYLAILCLIYLCAAWPEPISDREIEEL